MNQSFLTGEQFEIRRGDMRAVITELGAGLRLFSIADQAVIDGFSELEMPSFGRGQVLIPFPNRVASGTYEFQDISYQLSLTDVQLHHAIHGFTRWMNWQPVSHDEDSLVLALVLHAQPGYPFVLALEVRYDLTQTGLQVQTSAQNIGSSALPFGTGNHPYFTVGSSTINQDYLRIPAQSYLSTDDQSIPVMPPVRVAGTPYDFREMRAIGDTIIDLCFTDLIRDADGFARVLLSPADRKRTLSIYVDTSYQCVQIFTGDTIPDISRRRRGLAVESCTCAPNAYNNGYGLVILAPGQSFSCTWGVTAGQQ